MITLALITVLNIYGVKLVAIVNNTGVIFEILGMVVFALFLAFAHNNERGRRDLQLRARRELRRVPGGDDAAVLPRRDVHVALRDLRLRHGVHPRRGDEEPAARGAEGRPRVR